MILFKCSFKTRKFLTTLQLAQRQLAQNNVGSLHEVYYFVISLRQITLQARITKYYKVEHFVFGFIKAAVKGN